MDNGRDRFETDINQKTGRKLSVYREIYRGTWIPANSQGTGRIIGDCINLNSFYENKEAGGKRIHPEDTGITKSNRDFVAEVTA